MKLKNIDWSPVTLKIKNEEKKKKVKVISNIWKSMYYIGRRWLKNGRIVYLKWTIIWESKTTYNCIVQDQYIYNSNELFEINPPKGVIRIIE